VSDRSRIQSQAGVSLADTYAVPGSIAGIERLETHEVHLTHEMGGTIFSERLQGFLARAATGALLQNVNFNVELGVFPPSVNRILSVCVLADVVARTNHCVISIQNNVSGREMPIWWWDSADDGEQQVRWSDDGAAVAVFIALRQTGINRLPTLLTPLGDERQMGHVFFRGATSGFGAGNVSLTALINVARPNTGVPPPGEPSSFGLPLPSW